MDFSAFIPVKGNSSRLPGKNLLPFAESNLLVHKIRQLQGIDCLREIIVSSESDRLLEIARAEGVNAVKRPKQFSDESRPFCEFIDYISTLIPNGHLLWANCTSPLVRLTTYRNAMLAYEPALASGHDSLISVTKLPHFAWDARGPLNFPQSATIRDSQKLSPIYIMTCGIFMISADNLRFFRDHFGPNPYFFNVSAEESIDIDTELDYILAKAIWASEYFIDKGEKCRQ